MNLPGIPKLPQQIVLYFQVHQPRRLCPINFFDLGKEPHYFDDTLNRSILERVSVESYLPATQLLLKLIRRYPAIKLTFSLSGVVIRQLQVYAPEALEGFRELVSTGHVEILSETFYHSLASLVPGDEFEIQVLQHAEKVYEVFGVRPRVFRNTELIYNDDIGKRVAQMGFQGIFAEGHEKLLHEKSPHRLYHHPEEEQLRIFLRNYRLSDDIAFRFMEGGHRLTVERYLGWLHAMPPTERIINLAMDYETFGEHYKRSTGIFEFLEDLLTAIVTGERFSLVLPSEVLDQSPDTEALSATDYVSWGDLERDVSAWIGNDMQKDAYNSVMRLEGEVRRLNNLRLLEYWRYLQTSDHFYYMSVKTDSEGSVHSYFSPFPSSYEAFINYMNVVTHLTHLISEEKDKPAQPGHDLSPAEAERQQVTTTTPVWALNLESVPHRNPPDDAGH